jgi:hypothetical protein
MPAIIAALLSLTTLFPAAPPAVNAPSSWTECADDDAECDAATEDDGDLCETVDCDDD